MMKKKNSRFFYEILGSKKLQKIKGNKACLY